MYPTNLLTAALCLAGTACSAITASAGDPAPPAGASGYHLASTWKVGGAGRWDYLTMDGQAGRLYVVRTDRVQVLDTGTGKVVAEVPGLDGGHGVALVPELHRGFVTSGHAGMVIAFDLSTLARVGEPIAVGQKPDAILYDPASKHVFAFDGGSDAATVIDPATNKVVATIPLGGAPESPASDGKGTVFVNLEDKSETLAIDAQTNAVTRRWPLAPGEAPTGLAFDQAKGRLFAGCANAKMIVLDVASGAHLAELPIGQHVDACAFDPALGFAFASNGDGTLTVVQESVAKPGEFRVVDNVPTQVGSRTMALDPITHAVYLATASFEPASAPGTGEKPKRPAIVPESFAILKFVR